MPLNIHKTTFITEKVFSILLEEFISICKMWYRCFIIFENYSIFLNDRDIVTYTFGNTYCFFFPKNVQLKLKKYECHFTLIKSMIPIPYNLSSNQSYYVQKLKE